MKKTLAIIAALTTLGFTLPSEAEANWGCNAPRIVSYTSCGRPVYAVYQIVGYDRCGNPVGRWVTQHVNCGCNTCNPRRPSHHGFSHGGFNHGSCNPGFSGSSGGFFFRFGR